MMNENNDERKSMPYDEYKNNGRKNERRVLNKPNGFKKKILSLINETKEVDELLNRTLYIMFLVNHMECHKEFLESRFDLEPNYYRTYSNIEKSKQRCIVELLSAGAVFDVKVNKMNKKDDRMWLAVFSVTYKELTIVNVVKYSKVKDFLARAVLEETDIEKGMTILSDKDKGDRVLGKQQYHSYPLKQVLDKIDDAVFDLMKYNTEVKNKKNNS